MDTGGTRVALGLRTSTETGERESPVSETALTSHDEATLVDLAVGGDADAFARLYERHVDRVYRHCYYYMGSRADAEDVAQQTFLRAWQAIGRYERSGAPILAWLLTIAGRSAISQLRRARELPGNVNQQIDALEDDPQDIVATLDSCDMVRDMVLELSPDRQQVIVLRFIEGLSIAEVASALGKSENNVSVVQHRALKDLKHRLLARQTRSKPRSHVARSVRDVVVRAELSLTQRREEPDPSR